MMSQEDGPGAELRLFFALPLGEQLREPVGEVQRSIGRAGAKIKWVEPENLHFTLKFLGEMPASVVERLCEVAGQVARRHKGFCIRIGGAGAFPRPSAARAIWLACSTGAEALTGLAADLEEALAEAGLAPKEKRPFRAHLTIGRNKSRHRAEELAQAIEAAADVDIGEMKVDGFVLMRSQLKPEGPVYSVVEAFRLG